jgi:WS/DGAT/MGAT family acyltransferase
MNATSQVATRPEPLSRADAAWLHMEQPTNHFVVTSLLLLDEPLGLDRLREALRRKLPALPRLSQRVVEPGWPLAPPRWEHDPEFQLDAHTHRVALPGGGGRDELEDLIGDLVGQPMDLQRPPWQSYLVEDYAGGSAVITRLHHCLGDGSALVQMQLALADSTRKGWQAAPPSARPARSRTVTPQEVLAGTLGAVRGVIGDPGQALGLLRTAVEGAGTLARLSLLDPDPPTKLRAEPGVLKRAGWSEPISLSAVKRIARVTGSTVNDVLVSVVAGGLGRHLAEAGAPAPRIRAMMPIDMRPKEGPVVPGNQFSLVLVDLPVGVRHPVERLMRVKIEMDRIKASLEGQVGWAVLTGLGMLPPVLELPAAGFFADKATLVLTNVIGPSRKLYLAGSPIRSQTFWEPESGRLTLGVSIFSYAGEVILGVIADGRTVPPPRELVTAFEETFAELASAV